MTTKDPSLSSFLYTHLETQVRGYTVHGRLYTTIYFTVKQTIVEHIPVVLRGVLV